MSAWVPVAPVTSRLQALGLDDVMVEGGYWGERQRINHDVTLPHIRVWLERMGWLANFAGEARSSEGRGEEFTDSEVYKYLEALCWESARNGFPEELEASIASLTSRIADEQSDDGYVGTAFGGAGQPPRYNDLAFGHELYCAGHLLQAVIARGRTAGLHDPLVAVGRRLADHVVVAFGPAGIDGVCGHPIIEMALAEMARLTGIDAYMQQASLFLERRGHHRLPRTDRGWEYFSDDIPVHKATKLRGHAVRALYLACGAVDVAADSNDSELMTTLERQLDHTLRRRTYITGGMGSRHLDEAFGEDDMLPPDRAYSETCAGVASVQLAWRLLLATGKPEYADIIERALYNVVSTGVAESGDRFFYANTLHQRTPALPAADDSPSLAFGGGMRAAWYDVSCCPTNIARTVASIGAYTATTHVDGVQIHQFMDAKVRAHLPAGTLVLSMRTAYPQDGHIELEVLKAPEEPVTISLRVPGWAGSGTIRDGGVERRVESGYASLTRKFWPGERVTLDLDFSPRFVDPDPRVDAIRGCRAVVRGPRVFCLELPAGVAPDVNSLRLDSDASIAMTEEGLSVPLRRLIWGGAHWELSEDPTSYPLVPYAKWGNSGSSTMRVWIPTDGDIK